MTQLPLYLLVPLALAYVAAVAGLHYYLWRKLVRDTLMAAPWRKRLTVLFAFMAIAVPTVVLLARFASPAIGRTVGYPAFIWMGFGLMLLSIFGVFDLARLAHRSARVVTRRPAEPVDPDRRRFFNRVIGGGAAVGAVSATGFGVYQALKTPGVKEVPITLSRLPRQMDGFTIVQLTDIHIGNTIGREWVQDMVDKANAAGGDLIAITGDLVDGRVADLRDAAAPLSQLRAEHGVYFVTGNHEYYSGADAWIEHIRTLGIRVLRNERVRIGNGEHSFDLAGIDDRSAHRWDGHGPDLAAAVAGRDSSRELVLLAHQPRQVRDAVEHGVGLQLSGHTHGGQIWPWHYLARAQQGGLLAGHSRHGKDGSTQLYISRGTGYWGPPVRVGAPAEITRVVLRAG
jgi:predicted MPP superfamily phosphohydrolase